MAMSVMTVGAWSATVDDLVAIDNDWTFFSDRYSANGTVNLSWHAGDLVTTPRLVTWWIPSTTIAGATMVSFQPMPPTLSRWPSFSRS